MKGRARGATPNTLLCLYSNPVGRGGGGGRVEMNGDGEVGAGH